MRGQACNILLILPKTLVLTHNPNPLNETVDDKAVRQRSDLLFIATSFWFEESPCAVRTNTAGLDRLCTLFVLSTVA